MTSWFDLPVKLLRRLSIAALCLSVAWGVFITVSATVSWSRTGGIMLIVAGLLGIAANIYSERHDRRRRGEAPPAAHEPRPRAQ
ncbi:hypothetical protein [Micromonospora sp.]|uniref:hypothetical protein n=1 Tax=Micromonospora sp. TaxID=1876 RepID=UPI003B3A53CA